MGTGDELKRVRGIGSEYAELLRAAGVNTVDELRGCHPGDLAEALVGANDAAIKSTRRRIVRRVPARAAVERWITHASTLDCTWVS